MGFFSSFSTSLLGIGLSKLGAQIAIAEEEQYEMEHPEDKSNGYYKNIGTRYNENWVWVNSPKCLYVVVQQEGDVYTISYSKKEVKNALENTLCNNLEGAKMMMDADVGYYENFGTLITNEEMDD